ncbi:MAG: AraC family transcriptional regulator [Muribaculaceae bacterium]|nr:AraC family transcriptional regulator [Muribaculaceae bacterium]
MLSSTLYEYSQLGCIVETLCFSLSLALIGNEKVRSALWLQGVKRILAFVLFLVGLFTAVQWTTGMSVTNPMMDLALNSTLLYIVTYLLTIAFLPLATANHITRNRLIITTLAFSSCLVLVWAGVLLDGYLSQMAVIVSMAIYLVETVRIMIVFFVNYKLLREQHHEPGSDDEARYHCLNIIVRSIILLSFFAVLYLFMVLLSTRFKALHNFAMLVVWAYLFVSIVNLIIDYNPLVKMDIRLVKDADSSEMMIFHPELTHKVDQWIERRDYCRPGVTMILVAEELSTNRTYLSQYINSRYNCSFNTWLTGLRIGEAKRLLQHSPTLSIEKIATAVGFATKSHFMSTFKTHEGMTPGQWRKQHLD